MGPPAFSECYICHREFGSRSLEIHERQCLDKWRRHNQRLPKSERKKTPSPPPDHRLLPKVTSSPARSPSPTLQAVSPRKSLSNSWPKQQTSKKGSTGLWPGLSSHMDKKRSGRPSTATLDKPKVLDRKLQHEIDMSEMSRKMMEKLVIKMEAKGSSDYSSDFSSTSSSSLSCKSPFDEDFTSLDSESETRKRPSTIRLNRPSSNIAVPVIGASTSRSLPRRGKTATIRCSLPLKMRIKLAEEILGAKDNIKIPTPCLTCGKEENPERFHSHPIHLNRFTRFKAKDKLAKDRANKEIPYKTISKLIVTKPNPLKYKSKLVESAISNNPSVDLSKNKNSTKKLERPAKVVLTDNLSKLRNTNKIKNVSSTTLNADGVKENAKTGQNPVESSVTKKDKISATKISSSSINKDDKTALKKKERRKQENKKIAALALRDTVEEESQSKEAPPKRSPATAERAGTAPLRLCYICGREFGSRSLKIHEPQCLEKWKRENDNLPEHKRRAEPRRPSTDLTKEEWNEYAWNMAQSQLVPCDNCGRTFLPDRLEVHLRGCKPPPGSKKAQEKSRERASSPSMIYGSLGRGSARPTIICYICGREFGTRSITIHEPQCLTKWKNENEKLPEHMRRPEPSKPEAILDEEGRINKEAMAEAAWHSHLETLVKCEGCGRTFFPDRLIIHQKSCKLYKDKTDLE